MPAGKWAACYGVKRVLLIGIIVWTVCDMSTILVTNSVILLFVVRAGMGCGEGVMMPCLHNFSANWFPEQERSLLVSIISAGTDFGTILALVVSPVIMENGNWTMIFTTFGLLSCILLIFYSKYVTSKPEDHPTISQEEREYIVSNRKGAFSSCTDSLPWKTLFTTKELWSIYIAHFCFNYGWYVLSSWLPQYFEQELGLDLAKHRMLSTAPYICGFIGNMIAGRVSDTLISSGYRMIYIRRLMNTLAFFLMSMFLFVLRYAETQYQAIFLLSGALFTGRAATTGFWVNMIDVGPEYAGATMGVSNAIATIPGIAGNLITGYILNASNQNWDLVFGIASAGMIFGGIVFLLFSTDQDVFQRTSRETLPLLSKI